MLMPMVAMMKVTEPMKTATLLSMRETISTGSISISPKTETEPAVTMTTMMAKSRKLTGRPRKLPTFICRSRLAEAGEVAEVQQQRREVADDEQHGVDHVADRSAPPVSALSPSVRFSEPKPAW